MVSIARYMPVKLVSALCLISVMQIALAVHIKPVRPDLGYVPTPPSASFLRGIAMGDEQFLFRAVGLIIQNSGDTFGRFSALKLYNYQDLAVWLGLQDMLDPRSNYMPSMAAYYFSQTQNTEDVRYLVDFLYDHARQDVVHKWWWLMQAIYLAHHKLKDPDLALKVALPLQHKDLPVMAQQLLAIVYEKRGELDQAFDIITEIQKHTEHISEKDLRYMEYFAEERLQRLEDYEKELKKSGRSLLPPLLPPNQDGR